MRTPSLFLTTCIVLLAVSAAVAHAAGAPQLTITWRADNYTPNDFEGRVLPSPNTPVTVSVEATIDGKLADLSKANIAWYKDGERFDFGPGLKETTFTASETDAGSHFVRATVSVNGATAEQTLRVPVVRPTAVLEVPYPDRAVPAESVANLTSVPYFFNASVITDFVFSWASGDLKQNSGSDNVLALKVGTPYTDSQRTVTVNSYIQNRKDPFEIVKLATDIFIK